MQDRDDLCNPGTFGKPLKIDKDNMPPVDVLMIWSVFTAYNVFQTSTAG